MEKKLKQEEIAFKKRLGEKIREHREEAGLSQFKLALSAHISRTQISRLENGEINTSIITLLRIAKAFNLDKEQIMDLLE